MFGKMGDLANLIKNASQIQARVKELQEKAESMSYSAESGAGAVSATVNGKLVLMGLRIAPDTIKSGDVEMLEDLIKSAVSAAQRKATEGLKEQMREMSGGMNLPPGLEKMLG